VSTVSVVISKKHPEFNNHLAIGGVVPFTTIDFPGKLSAVVFCKGCSWSCSYCQNPHLIATAPGNDWEKLESFMRQRKGLLEAIVFSGGEPLLQFGLESALMYCQEMGFATGLHSSGSLPQRFARVLPRLDWVGFDVKTIFSKYTDITGIPGSGEKARTSLKLLLDSNVNYEVRTTVDQQYIDYNILWKLALELKGMGVRSYVLQRCRTEKQVVMPDLLSDKKWLTKISDLFENFEVRS